MIHRHTISREQALSAIEMGEFGPDIINSNDFVVIILTQDWCPQWLDMQNWIYKADIDKTIHIYELIYNKVDYFNDFMRFKESRLKNYEIPYLRFYKNGQLFKETNYINQQKFISTLKSR